MSFILMFTILPVFCAFMIALLSGKAKNSSDVLAKFGTLALFIASLYLVRILSVSKVIVYKIGLWQQPLGISVVADHLTGFMLVTVNLVAFLVIVYAVRYLDRYTDKWKFYSLFMLMLAGMNGVLISGDLFNLYVFVELASISAYALVAFGVEPEDLEASFKYLVMGAVASIFILLAIALLYGLTSTLNMSDMAGVLSTKPKGLLINFVCVLFLAGFGLKAAIVPFHAWLPDAHSSAPAPVSATLSGVLIKTLGIYALSRIFFNVIGVTSSILFILMALGIISMVVGAFLAIAQNDIKRIFAYSSISQIGYIVFALGLGTPLAITGALFYLFNHALFKSLLFMAAGSIEYSTGTRKLDELGGLNKKLPVTGFSSLIGSMSISGIPPLGGFWCKLLIIVAAIQAGHILMASVAVLISILTLAYYMKFQSFAFFGKLKPSNENIKESPLTMKMPMIIMAVLCILAGFLLISPLSSFLKSAADVLISGTGYKDIILGQ